MAGEWIKMRNDLASDPAVIAVACALDMDEDTVVGKLHRLWAWADQHTTDGNASVTLSPLQGAHKDAAERWIDRYLKAPGFAAALVSVGWLRLEDENGHPGICIPKFDSHNSKSAKERALTSKRVAETRAKNPPKPTPEKLYGKCNGATVTEALPEKSTLRNETKRNKNTTPVTPFSENPPDETKRRTKRVLTKIQDADLADIPKLLEAFSSLTTIGHLDGTEIQKINFLTAAETSRRAGTKPGGMFSALVIRKDWATGTGDDEDQARRRLKAHLDPPGRRSSGPVTLGQLLTPTQDANHASNSNPTEAAR